MAGIEKCCELCPEYPGWRMYGIKRNHIQVCIKCRSKFKGEEATLLLFKPDLKDYKFNNYFMNGKSVRMYPFEYCLVVQSLQGDVEGYYYNQTTDNRGFGKIVRRMRKLIGKELKVMTINSTMNKFIEDKWEVNQ